MIRVVGGSPQFGLCLVEQVLGFLCMTTEVLMIAGLCDIDFVNSIIDEVLRSGNVWMPFLGHGYAPSDKHEANGSTTQHQISSFHGEDLRQTMYQIGPQVREDKKMILSKTERIALPTEPAVSPIAMDALRG